MILIALGSSLPFSGLDSQEIVLRAFSALDRIGRLNRRSRLFETPAWPDPADPPFVNAAAAIETGLAPEALLAALHAVEAGFGRRHSARNAPRTLDLDLLAYGEERRDGDGLVLPHPRLSEREFVLAPLADIAPDWLVPGTGRTVAETLAALPARSARPIGEK